MDLRKGGGTDELYMKYVNRRDFETDLEVHRSEIWCFRFSGGSFFWFLRVLKFSETWKRALCYGGNSC